MVENLLFITGLTLFLFVLSIWGFKFLPREKWQVLGTLPIVKSADGKWQGLNLTYYGLFNGVAVVIAAAIMIILLGAAAMPVSGTILFLAGVLVFAVPAAKIVARLVEKK
ncbi:MAG: prolipoprotein diacylglyceryl transferase, partial [bacterium]